MQKLSYLTKRLKLDIKKGGIVIAPRRAGKTQAIIELLEESNEYLLICNSLAIAKDVRNRLLDRHKIDIKQVEESMIISGQRFSDKKLIIDECFWNPSFYSEDYHCAVSSNPSDLIVYNDKGKRFKIKKNAIWN
jgi:hypothetical protein